MAGAIELSIVCPFYNEQANVEPFLARLVPILKELKCAYEIVCVNDGSDDRTLEYLQEARNQHPELRIISLSRNFGKEAALHAGLDYSSGNRIIPIDADLQDPPEVIPRLIEEADKGFDVVLAKRTDRNFDSVSKRLSASLFYKFHNMISRTKLPENCGDFRLINREVVDAISTLPENQLFMKGVFAWVGFKVSSVDYKRELRSGGNSKFGAWKLWNFALDGITGFSTAPLRIWSYIGMTIAMLTLIYAAVILVKTLVYGIDVPGYASLLISVLFLGSIQLISIGVLGEYIGRVYLEVKSRPKYIVHSEW